MAEDEDDAWMHEFLDPAIVTEGAAADSADDQQQRIEGLPRILRYALLARNTIDGVVIYRLVAEIEAICPDLSQLKVWAAVCDEQSGLALATDLDRIAVLRDMPLLRTLGDCVRLLSLTLPCDSERFESFRRVCRAMILAFGEVASAVDDQQRFELEQVIYGFAASAAATRFDRDAISWPAATFAMQMGVEIARYRIRAAQNETARRIRREIERQQGEASAAEAVICSASDTISGSAIVDAVPPNHVVVGRLDENTIKAQKHITPFRNVLNVALPLVETPALDHVRATLMIEFPYASNVIDFVLTDLTGRPTATFRPLLLVGEPGSGKSRFARRLGEVLRLTIWRTDAAQSDGNTFAGTDRRWHSTEPCHPFLAIARGETANPVMLIDEIEKAGTRSDYGRFWDCLLGLLEQETSSRYPDPALQIPIDLSHVSYVATANAVDPIPTPLRDRLRIVAFPSPTLNDLDVLLPSLMKSIAAEHGVDSRWITSTDAVERSFIASAWSGGSVRRLRHVLEAVIRARDQAARRH